MDNIEPSNDSWRSLPDAHPADAIDFTLRKLFAQMPKEQEIEGRKLISMLFAYFRDDVGDKIREAESKASRAKWAVERKDDEIKALEVRIEQQCRLLKESSIKDEMNRLYHKLSEVSFCVRG